MSPPRSGNSDRPRKWVLPAEIPFSKLKRRDLEECVYWLLDAMGARDLEWRTGGTGDGAADGGRDLEAHFYTTIADGELESKKWRIECKGRNGTVEPRAVKDALTNAASQDLDYIVIATNTQFSNPTRDWVKMWQAVPTRPKVKLWDRAQLERYLSQHPDVVLRLFSKALSLDGRFRAMEERFWNRLEFVTPQTLADLWDNRGRVEFTAMGIVAAIANEFAHGSVVTRPWAGFLGAEFVLEILSIALQNILYLAFRCSDAGVDQKVIFRSLAYLVLTALDRLSTERVSEVIMRSVARGELSNMPETVQDMLLAPFLAQLQSEVQDVCAAACKRVSCGRIALPAKTDEVPNYWIRLEPEGIAHPENPRTLRLEKMDEPCVVGFPVGKDQGCPLFAIEPSVKSAGEVLAVIQRVAAFRRAEASEKRKKEAQARPTKK